MLKSSGGKPWTSSTRLAMLAVLGVESAGNRVEVGGREEGEGEEVSLEGFI